MKTMYNLNSAMLFLLSCCIVFQVYPDGQRREGRFSVAQRARTNWHALIQQADSIYYQVPDANAGRTAAQEQELVSIRELYTRVTQQNDDASARAHAQMALADMCTFGDGGAVDYARARNLYECAASQRVNMVINARATVRLGDIYKLGEGVPANDVRARSYYTIAAVQNYDLESKALAQAILGNMYYFGEGVPVDYVHARELLRQAGGQNVNQEVQRAAHDRLAEMDNLGI